MKLILRISNSNSIYDFSCKTERFFPSSKTYLNSPIDKIRYYSCSFTLTDKGVFQMNGFLVIKGTSQIIKINSNINDFSIYNKNYYYSKGIVINSNGILTNDKTITISSNNTKLPSQKVTLLRNLDTYEAVNEIDENSLTFKNILNLYNNTWININNAQLTYLSDSSGLITILDLAINGSNLISSYKLYPSGFNVNNVKAILYNTHDNHFTNELVTKIINIDGVEYIGIYTKDNKATDEIIKKSTFQYSIRFILLKQSENEEKTVSLKYILNVGTYTTCFHDLKIENTNLEQDSSLELPVNNQERKIAKIELRTEDYNLYN